jgi:hypothetical protein
MPNYTEVIFQTGNSLKMLLANNNSYRLTENDIILFSPGDPSEPLPKLSLFLYQLREDPNYVNASLNGIALELFYMLIPNSTSTDIKSRAQEEHKWIGAAMNILHVNAILPAAALQGELAYKDYQIKITLNPVTLDDLTKIWQSLQPRPFKLSVCYRVGPVFIESEPEVSAAAVKTIILGQQ